MIICPECAKKIIDSNKECPECGCPKSRFVSLINRDEKDYIVLMLGRYRVRFNGKYWNYIQLRKVYELTAGTLMLDLQEAYRNAACFGSIIKSFPNIVGVRMDQMLDWSMKLLYEYNIPMSVDNFLEKYFEKNNYYAGGQYYNLDYNEIITEVVEQYAEVTNKQSELAEYREMQKASRSKWRGYGFGVKGAVKGAIMAGVVNAGTDFMRSFGDAAQRKSDDEYINSQINALRNSKEVHQKLIGGAYNVIIGVFNAVFNELCENNVLGRVEFNEERWSQARNIYTATTKYETDDKKIIIGCLNAITTYPYYFSPYATLYEKYKKTPEEASIYHFLDFFGINAKIGETTVAKYMKVDHLLEQWVDLSKFDFDKLTADQYYEAKQAIGKVQEEFLKSEYMASANCSRLYDYILKCEISDVSKDESTEEKQAPMEEYIPLLIKRHTDEHSLGGYKDCMWVAGTEMQGPFIFKNDLQEVYDKKFIEEGKKYLLIYDNGNFFYGKDGFGIFDVGMVFFTTGKIFLFKDIVGCSFNEEKFSLIIKSVQDSYEFEYKKRSKVLFKSLYNKPGYFFTEEVIYKIIEHYQKLNGINLLKK